MKCLAQPVPSKPADSHICEWWPQKRYDDLIVLKLINVNPTNCGESQGVEIQRSHTWHHAHHGQDLVLVQLFLLIDPWRRRHTILCRPTSACMNTREC